jgi:hypothetical protein
MSTNIPRNNVTVPNGGLGYPPNQVYYVGGGGGGGTLGTAATGISASNWTTNTLTVPPSGRMELQGAHADIVMNGVSLNDTLKLIQDRLNMLRPNPELEQEWDQLRDLGEQYRELEKQLIEKQRAWDLLRKKEG